MVYSEGLPSNSGGSGSLGSLLTRGGSVVNYLLEYQENPESINERSIDESFSKVLANSPRLMYPKIKIDVPLDSHMIHFYVIKSPKIAWKGSNRTKIKNIFTLDAFRSNKNDDKALW